MDIMDDLFVNEYLKNLNAVPADNFSKMTPEDEVIDDNTYDGVSKEVLNLEQLETKLNDINTALTNFESKSNEWHQFLIQQKDNMNCDQELFKQYESDEANTLASINKIKGLLLQINTQMSVLKDTLKQ